MSKEYDVGRGKPPKDYTWKKGQSGNPSGLRKSKPEQSLEATFRKVLAQQLKVTENGKRKKIYAQELVFRALVQKAAAGDISAIKEFFRIAGNLPVVQGDEFLSFRVTESLIPMLEQFMNGVAGSAEPHSSD